MRFRDWMFVFVMPPALSACMGMCNCFDVPANWRKTIPHGTQRVVDPDSGYYVMVVADCTATATRGNNVISFEVGPSGCTKTGGDPLGDSGRECGADVAFDDAHFALDAADEAYLGGVDFSFNFVCDDGVEDHSDEHFQTRMCAD